ncbi:MAG: M20/M25/M40 family metallo-hydrolase [Chloroflexi bacterium]|nr:M20/M25/M40 family metallo-hydrolase [Chloroflexota bacterium]
MKHLLRNPLIVVLALMVGTLACSLTAEPPATLPPRTPVSQATTTPQSTIGPQFTVQAQDPANAPQLPGDFVAGAPAGQSMQGQLALVDSNRLWNTITTLVNFEDRYTLYEPSQSKGIYAARDYILTELYKLQTENPNVRIDAYTHQFQFNWGGEGIYAENIVMVVNGTDPDAGIVLVGAHYDTISDIGATRQPGANDNGTGVAAVLEIARIIAQKPHRATVIFVFFSGEELGMYGSKAYVEEFIKPNNIPLRAVMNLDMIGSPTGPDGSRHDNEMRVFSSKPNSSQSRQLARLSEFAARYFVPDMKVWVQDDVDRPGRWGDHIPFTEAGFPSIRFIEQADDATRMHNLRDSTEDIDAAYLQRTTKVALATLLILADGPPPPQDIRINPANWRIEWLPSRDADRYVLALRRPGSLVYDQEITVDVTGFTWPDLRVYEAVAIAAIDSSGQVGPFSNEILITSVAQ